MNIYVIYGLKTAGCLLAGIAAGFAAVSVFNGMPVKWLCDYGEKPMGLLAEPGVPRIKAQPWKWVFSAGFFFLLMRMVFAESFQALNLEFLGISTAGYRGSQLQMAAAALFACWALLIIGLSDLKFMIIPDQFVVMLAISSIGFVPFQKNLWQPLLGLLVGGGAMLAVSGLGALLKGSRVLGFGDVKLMASLGLILGLWGILAVLVVSSLLSGIAAAVGLASGKWKKTDAKPLGPYICGSGAAVIFFVWPMVM